MPSSATGPGARPSSAVGEPAVSAGAIAGLLADADRRRCFAALVLGATSSSEVVSATGLTVARVGKAMGRLVAGGLVSTSPNGDLAVADSALHSAARQALSKPKSDDFADEPDDVRKVLGNFIVDGRITQIPTSSAKRRVVLDWLAQEFEPGRRYSEQMVNLILGQRHPDPAALRRHLVDDGLLDRAEGRYWRSGGRVTEQPDVL